MEIITIKELPGRTYFRTSQVMPHIDGNGNLVIYDGRGERRSWGTPQVHSTVTHLSEDVIKVHVVGWHKHTKSPVGGDFYFVNEKKHGWVRRTKASKVVQAALK